MNPDQFEAAKMKPARTKIIKRYALKEQGRLLIWEEHDPSVFVGLYRTKADAKLDILGKETIVRVTVEIEEKKL